ncbi:E3 ubiquitin-protein ligase HECTD3 [Protopterus annectens]|uniref:E3 ubiquitin-protein ligase HECTD3 n=1 Tax=Protopterus annectens TaxID=7888 RepID=UPI001CFB1A8D|nr:E3 ubiquitin-protein ligase HECTD3 [Protopterus annectens]
MTPGENPHLLLGRIRFLLECIECFRETKTLPEALSYVPKDVYYKLCKDSSSSTVSAGKNLIPVWESPSQSKQSKKLFKFNIEAKKGTCIRATGEEYWNSYGLWVRMNKEQLEEYKAGCELEEGWILMCKHADGGDRLVPVESPDRTQKQQLLYGYDYKPFTRWEQVVDATYSHFLGPKMKIAEPDEAAVTRLRYIPPTWTYECDEDLVHCFCNPTGKEAEDLGSAKQYVDNIEVSSYMQEDSSAWCLTDGFAETYWESDGSQGLHWIRLHMRKSIIVKKLSLTLDPTDDTYLPKKVAVYGGERDNLKLLNEVNIDETMVGEVCVLEEMTVYMPVIEIRILECKDEGIDVRIRGINIKSSRESNLGLNVDMFQPNNLIRYPRLEGTDPDVLYRRAQVIQRFVTLLDSLLNHLVPAWDYSVGTFLQLKFIKQFLLLSKRRSALITQCLKDTESNRPYFMPRLYINRRLAMEHRDNPSLDPSYKNTVFSQVYEGLKPSDKHEKSLDYRWPLRYDQWWECKFIAEGIIDQGGGFRDSLADISEELCPSSADSPVPLPFFVRTSNQGNDTGEGRDMYVPNPSCKDFSKYEWIGQLMGAAFRGKEFLVLALPGIVWKQLTGEPVNWKKDFPAVDSMLVKLLEALEDMDKETFEFKFAGELMYTTVLSDQQVMDLIPGGSQSPVKYEDRKEFIQLAKKARLDESKKQIAAMQAGLVKVVPQAILDLLTWQELEKKVCGDPEITVEALKRLTRYEDLEQSDSRLQYLWEALTNFTNEDRSRFLRFVSGRSRLPAPIFVCPDKSGVECTDALPESSTCSSTLFLPNYPSAKICEEKLRYAAYNCVAIDTDMSPWEE